MYILASRNDYFTNKLFGKLTNKYNDFRLITTKEDLNKALKLEPNKIFFFHWSYIVPNTIIDNYECINLHTSNLPFGKGGSPIQNQILDGIIASKINALRMSDKIDGGPIYCSLPVTLQGSLFDIWNMLTEQAFEIIKKIIDENLKPMEQQKIENEIIYKRRKDNRIPFDEDLENIYNFIRMLDDPSYPNPYVEVGKYKLEFSRAKFDGESILCDTKIYK